MTTTTVGLGQWRVSRNPGESLCILGLGSAIALCLYDPHARAAALAHVMLPSGRDGEETPAKYCDLVVPFLLDKLGDAPATPEDLRVAVLGGATMMCRGTSALLEIGNRNAAAIVAALNEAGLVPTVLDVGGVQGRTVMVDVGSGRITVKVLRQPDRVFADLTAPTEV